jgi:hypothetical protein
VRNQQEHSTIRVEVENTGLARRVTIAQSSLLLLVELVRKLHPPQMHMPGQQNVVLEAVLTVLFEMEPELDVILALPATSVQSQLVMI